MRRVHEKQTTRCHDPVIDQLLKLVSRVEIAAPARRYGLDAKSGTFSVWRHLVTMCFVQFVHATSLNDVCDWMRAGAQAFGMLDVIVGDDKTPTCPSCGVKRVKRQGPQKSFRGCVNTPVSGANLDTLSA